MSMQSPEEVLGDYIGMESCADMKPDVGDIIPPSSSVGPTLPRRVVERKREYPPPIPLLARNENLPPHIPSVMKRHYTSDGRLVIVEERVRRHQYFETHREDGRLVINLVSLLADNGAADQGEDEEEGLFENVTAGIDGDSEAVSECCKSGAGGYEVAVLNSPVHT